MPGYFIPRRPRPAGPGRGPAGARRPPTRRPRAIRAQAVTLSPNPIAKCAQGCRARRAARRPTNSENSVNLVFTRFTGFTEFFAPLGSDNSQDGMYWYEPVRTLLDTRPYEKPQNGNLNTSTYQHRQFRVKFLLVWQYILVCHGTGMYLYLHSTRWYKVVHDGTRWYKMVQTMVYGLGGTWRYKAVRESFKSYRLVRTGMY